MRNTTTILLIALALTLGCNKSDEYQPKKTPKIKMAQVAVGEERTLAPLALGNQWVYTQLQGNMKTEITLKVIDVRQTPEGDTLATIDVHQEGGPDGVKDQTMVWLVSDTGIYQVSSGTDIVYDPPQLLVPFPLKKDNEFQVVKHEGTGARLLSEPGPYKATVTVIGAQEIDTDSGRMSAIAIQSLTDWETEAGPVASSSFTWWRPDIGFVRQTQEIRTPAGTIKTVLKLKSYSFPRRSQ